MAATQEANRAALNSWLLVNLDSLRKDSDRGWRPLPIHDFYIGGQCKSPGSKKQGQKGQTFARRPSSFAMASTSNISSPTFLTENDMPGASLMEENLRS